MSAEQAITFQFINALWERNNAIALACFESNFQAAKKAFEENSATALKVLMGQLPAPIPSPSSPVMVEPEELVSEEEEVEEEEPNPYYVGHRGRHILPILDGTKHELCFRISAPNTFEILGKKNTVLKTVHSMNAIDTYHCKDLLEKGKRRLPASGKFHASDVPCQLYVGGKWVKMKELPPWMPKSAKK